MDIINTDIETTITHANEILSRNRIMFILFGAFVAFDFVFACSCIFSRAVELTRYLTH